MRNTTYVYTCSSKFDMVEQLEESIQSLTKYVKSEQIVVFFTPPISQEDVQRIENLGVEVREKPHYIPKSMQVGKYDSPSYYSDKFYFTQVNSENVVFLDCDTLIKGDIRQVLKGDFQFKARLVPTDYGEKWKSFAKNHVDNPVPEFNGGFLIFKDYLHKDIKADFAYFLKKNLDKDRFGDSNTHDQYALSLALGNALESDSEIERMNQEEHSFAWMDERFSDCEYVFHRSDNSKISFARSVLASIDCRVPFPVFEVVYG